MANAAALEAIADVAALIAARLQAAEIENPALSTMLGDPPIAPRSPAPSLNSEQLHARQKAAESGATPRRQR